MTRCVNPRSIGATAELIAANYLTRQGLTLLTSNFTCKCGEIDLIMRDVGLLVFVEVRFRRNTNYGNSLETITAKKQAKLIATARYYLQQYRLTEKAHCRFDVVGILATLTQPEITWIQNAFLT